MRISSTKLWCSKMPVPDNSAIAAVATAPMAVLWTENVVSAISRDLLAAALLRLERAGYRVVLHVHDEAIAEVPIGFGSTEEFTRLMITPPSWALGLPIAAQAWSGSRFLEELKGRIRPTTG